MIKQLIFITLLFIGSSNLFAGDTTSEQGAWLLDEVSGTRSDETSNSNDLTDNNTVPQEATCQFDECADFTAGNSEYLSITDASQTGLDFTGDYTLMAWISADNPGNQWIVAKASTLAGYGLQMQGTPLYRCTHRGTNEDSSTTPDATFRQIACVYDGVDVEIFVDGTSEGSSAITTDASNTTNAFVIGSFDGVSNFFTGHIDEVYVFSRALAESEIDDIHDNGIAAYRTPAAGARRVILIALGIWQPLNFQYYNKVYKHRKKFNIPRPAWMKVFEIREAIAAPIQAATDKVITEWAKRKGNDEVKVEDKYIQQASQVRDNITYQTHVYDGPRGVGYTQIAQKVEDEKTYQIERHFGPETDRLIKNNWTEIERN